MGLVKQAQKGNSNAFVELIEQNKMAMYKVAKSYLYNEEDAADAMQDTVLAVYEHIGQLKEPKYFKTWMIRILINKCKNILRKQSNYCPLEKGPEQVYEDHSQSDIEFFDMLRVLPEEDRMIFSNIPWMKKSPEFTVQQIAQTLDIKENTIMSRLSRGRKKIYNQMQAIHMP